MTSARIALLVDGDNVRPAFAGRALAEAALRGRVDVARVYAAADRPSEWTAAAGYRLIHAGSGKNAADLLLSIDAMELALERGFEAFVVVSSDGDFTHLAQRLRERGRFVLGLGEAKAPRAFRATCSEFLVLSLPEPERPGIAPAPTPAAAPAPAIARPTEFDRKIRTIIAQHSRAGRGIRIADLSPKMHAAHGIQISSLPERTWRTYLAQRPALYDLDPRGPEAMVRFRPDGFAGC